MPFDRNFTNWRFARQITSGHAWLCLKTAEGLGCALRFESLLISMRRDYRHGSSGAPRRARNHIDLLFERGLDGSTVGFQRRYPAPLDVLLWNARIRDTQFFEASLFRS